METFTSLKDFVINPHFSLQRKSYLDRLDLSQIDSPLTVIIKRFATLPYCFTLQCCYGHFLCNKKDDPHNLDPLPANDSIATVEYRIAYLALCIENNRKGNVLFEDLKKVSAINPEYIQFGCAEWFWKRQLNSYALQVEPQRFKKQDRAIVDIREAHVIDKIRKEFFDIIRSILQKHCRQSF